MEPNETWSTAEVATQRADRYVKQLTQHFGRNRRVESSDEESMIEFDGAVCRLRPGALSITITIEGRDDELCATAERVIGSHLTRFGGRDDLEVSFRRSDGR